MRWDCATPAFILAYINALYERGLAYPSSRYTSACRCGLSQVPRFSYGFMRTHSKPMKMKTKWQEEQCYDFIDRHPVLFLNELSERQARLFMIEGSISDFLTGEFEDKFEYRVFYYAYRRYYSAKGIHIRAKRGRLVVRKFCYFQDFLGMRNRFQMNLDLFDFDKYPRMVRNAYWASRFPPSFYCFFVSRAFTWLLAIVLMVTFLLCVWAVFS